MATHKTTPVINARHLTRVYTLGDSDVIGINDIGLDIAPGELVVLKGNSGSGKSTLLSLIAGLDRPTRGFLNVADHDLTKATPSDLTHFRRNVVGRGVLGIAGESRGGLSGPMATEDSVVVPGFQYCSQHGRPGNENQ